MVSAVKPDSLYIDVHPEMLEALRQEVASGRSTANGHSGWKVPSSPPGLSPLIPISGPFSALPLRNALADNEMLALLGGEALGAYKAALAAAAALGGAPTAAAVTPAGTPTPLATATPPKLLAFPYPMSYRMWETMLRPVDYTAWVVGNSSVGSTALSVYVGNPNAWMMISATNPAAASAAEGSGDGSIVVAPPAVAAVPTTTTNPGEPPSTPEVAFLAELPPAGYYTRSQVTALQREFKDAVGKVGGKATIASCDMDRDLLEREAQWREGGDANNAESCHQRALQAQACAQAVAHTLKAAAAEAAAAAAPGGGAVVAIVNLGGMGVLQRNWEFSRPPEEALPPFTLVEKTGSLVIPGAVVSGLGYGLHRLSRVGGRVGRYTAATLGFLLVSGVATTAYTATYADWTRYGTNMRAALASPRTVSPLARVNK